MIIKCKMCGGDLNFETGMTVCECEFCGTQQTIPNADSEKKANLFNRANRLRMASEFDKAAAMYEAIVAEFPEEAEAYWGLCLCAFGIEYVDDAATGRKIPTCHRTRRTSIMDDSNFSLACEYADPIACKLYQDEAKEIDRLQKSILQIVAREEPYDVFICYKETDADNNRTEDSVIAQDIYDALQQKGLKVFFARITLEDKLGQQYEPYIYAALHSAKVMLAVGTSFEYFDAVWVKNEWSRFLAMAEEDRGKTLIPCYKGIDPSVDMPKEFRNLQAQDMSKLGWMQDLTRGVMKLCGKKEQKQSSEPSAMTNEEKIELSLSLIQDAIQSKEYEKAQKLALTQLEKYPRNGDLFYYLFLTEVREPSILEVRTYDKSIRRRAMENSRLMRALQLKNSFQSEIVAGLKELYIAELELDLDAILLREDKRRYNDPEVTQEEVLKDLEKYLIDVQKTLGAYISKDEMMDIFEQILTTASRKMLETDKDPFLKYSSVIKTIKVLTKNVPDNEKFYSIYNDLGDNLLKGKYMGDAAELAWKAAAACTDSSSATSYMEGKRGQLYNARFQQFFLDAYGKGKESFSYFFIKKHKEQYKQYEELLNKKAHAEKKSTGWLTIIFSLLIIACAAYIIFDAGSMYTYAQIVWCISLFGACYFYERDSESAFVMVFLVLLYIVVQLLNSWIGGWWLIGGLVRLIHTIVDWIVMIIGIIGFFCGIYAVKERCRLKSYKKQIDNMYSTVIQPLEQSLYEELKEEYLRFLQPDDYEIVPEITPAILENQKKNGINSSLISDVENAARENKTVAQYLAEKDAPVA